SPYWQTVVDTYLCRAHSILGVALYIVLDQ
ncbi:unnamed protein product, partial [marine sediment metagenome]